MADLNNGGPAFPRPFHETSDGNFSIAQVGMTLRDYFAGKALSGWPVTDHGSDADALARKCYAMADAMIAARGEVT
ncbi:hypothetical protein DEA98_14170 [Brucella pseudogrignonensis]|uniref:Gp38 n=1 Tax=Brucella pseudogrignonensis TaxID=419475 RepID=A0A7Y3WVP3_9HYPH|nr:hypothetical protein [Brucella pseudogrignonensis]NNV20560.1 hypothetical protein [Brucella pseudogrignonensis]